MKAIVYREYGSPDVLRCEEVEKPSAGDGEVLLRVRAAGVNPYDWHFMRGLPYPLRMRAGLRRPKDPRLGADVSGRVDALGKNVTRFKPGDEVFGACRGAFAEYACAAEGKLAVKPQNVSFEEAASVPIAALTALQGLRRGGLKEEGVKPRPKALINGAAGGVGTFAVQIARAFGAGVTGVCSTRNVEMVKSIGAERVIDYTREDFTTGMERYDVILDCVANHSLSACRKILNPQGRYVMVGAGDGGGRWMTRMLARILKALVMSRSGGQQFVVIGAKVDPADLAMLSELMATEKVKPVIDKCYPLREAAEAIRYIEGGHARGKVVIRVE